MLCKSWSFKSFGYGGEGNSSVVAAGVSLLSIRSNVLASLHFETFNTFGGAGRLDASKLTVVCCDIGDID